MTTTASGLQYQDTQQGTGDVAQAGQRVSVHYTGWLHDPTQPDGRGASSTPARTGASRSSSISAPAW